MHVCYRLNVKLGGINTIPDPRSAVILTDPSNPTIVMGVRSAVNILTPHIFGLIYKLCRPTSYTQHRMLEIAHRSQP